MAKTSEGESNTAETQTRTHVLDSGPQIPPVIRQRNSSPQNIYLTSKDLQCKKYGDGPEPLQYNSCNTSSQGLQLFSLTLVVT